MLATMGKPFDSANHMFEIKWDGIRALAFFEGARCRLQGRKLTDRSQRYPEIMRGISRLEGNGILDGEIIVLDDDGRPNFQRVLIREQTSNPERARLLIPKHPAIFVAFDLLFWNDQPLVDKPLVERKDLLSRLLDSPPSPIIASTYILEKGLAFYDEAVSERLEGIVAKRLDSPYRIGVRSDAWQKIKIRQQLDCVLVGTLREAGIERVRSLVLGVYQRGTLRWIGNVGSGLDHRTLLQLQTELTALESDEPTLSENVPGRIRWLAPTLVVRVEYLELTNEGRLRHPVFLGFVDTAASSCVAPDSEAVDR